MANIFRDTFTEAGSDVVLGSHTPDTGTGWVQQYKTTVTVDLFAVAATDRLAASSDENTVGLAYSASPNPSNVDYVVEFRIAVAISPTDPGSKGIGLLARWTDNSNFYAFQLMPPPHTANDRKIFKTVAATETELASSDYGDSNGQLFQFIITDSKKSVRQDGVEILSTTDNALTSSGKAGIWMGDFVGDSRHCENSWEMDDFRIYDIPQEAHPDSDVSLGNWTDQASGTTNIYQSIDEVTASETDYVESADSPNLDVLEVGLSNLSDPATGDAHYVHFRYRKQGNETIDLRVRLLQGATEIASWTYSAISTTWVYKRELLTSTQANNITNYADLRLEFRADVP